MHKTGFPGLWDLTYFCLRLCHKSVRGFSSLQLLFIAGGCPKSHLRAADAVPDVKENIFKFKLRIPWTSPCAGHPAPKAPSWIM